MGRPRKYHTEEERKAARAARNARYFNKPDKKAAQRERCKRRAAEIRQLTKWKLQLDAGSNSPRRHMSVCSNLTEALLEEVDEDRRLEEEEPASASKFSQPAAESIRAMIAYYDRVLQEFLDHRSEIDFAKRQVDISLSEIATGRTEQRVQELEQLEQEVGVQEKGVQQLFYTVTDTDPTLDDPLTKATAASYIAFTRIRRRLRQEKRLVAAGSFKQWFDEGKLLWQGYWNKDVDYQAEQLEELSLALGI